MSLLNEFEALSCAPAAGSELGRRGTPGLRLFAAVVATKPGDFFLDLADISAFFSSFDICDTGVGGVGGLTTTWAPTLIVGEVSAASSSSEVCGDINRAVGRGPELEGPLLFLSIGGGMAAAYLERLEDCRPLEESLSCLPCIAVVLAVPGPRVRDVVCN